MMHDNVINVDVQLVSYIFIYLSIIKYDST